MYYYGNITQYKDINNKIASSNFYLQGREGVGIIPIPTPNI